MATRALSKTVAGGKGAISFVTGGGFGAAARDASSPATFAAANGAAEFFPEFSGFVALELFSATFEPGNAVFFGAEFLFSKK
jgi:hypothetical protein